MFTLLKLSSQVCRKCWWKALALHFLRKGRVVPRQGLGKRAVFPSIASKTTRVRKHKHFLVPFFFFFYLYMPLIASISIIKCNTAHTHWAGPWQHSRTAGGHEPLSSLVAHAGNLLQLSLCWDLPWNHAIPSTAWNSSLSVIHAEGLCVGPSPPLGAQPECLAGWFLRWETILVQNGRCCCIVAWLETLRES